MTRPVRTYRPEGAPTRGKTARNRLRRVDIFALLYAPDLIRRADAPEEVSLYVDLGYGAEAYTTLESAVRFRQHNAALRVLGVEIEPDRVAAAQPYADGQTFFRLGGFNLPLQTGERVRLLRAFNVLRQYEEAQVLEAWQRMGSYLEPGGLLIEGTSDPLGRIWTANVLRREPQGLRYEALVFSTNFHWGFEPSIFQPVLPKNLIHRMVAGEEIYSFMEAWKETAREMIGLRAFGLRQWFAGSAAALAERGYDLLQRKKYLQRGFLVWRPNAWLGRPDLSEILPINNQ